MFWQCPIPEHQGRYPEPIRQTVRWEGNVAYCTTEGCGNSSAATPPLVAASPVPPVVPDKPALDYPPAFGGCSCACHVMPVDHVRACCWPEANASVPAVTEHEAATEALALALWADRCIYEVFKDIGPYAEDRQRAENLFAHLRSAGFLLVRDHTKET
jgi:hypothetical protein